MIMVRWFILKLIFCGCLFCCLVAASCDPMMDGVPVTNIDVSADVPKGVDSVRVCLSYVDSKGDSSSLCGRKDLDVYVAKEPVVYIFSDEAEAAKFKRGLQQISFPEADSKLPRCFPALKMELNLKGGRKVLVFLRRPGFYPAELFSPWPSEHLAWVISRMENLCCAFEYSDIQHTGISPESIFVNPITHEGAIFGDWRQVSDKAGSKDLEDLRKTAKLLASNTRKPVQMYDFLNSKPTSNAFEDFKKWDTVIEEGFGGHNFIKM